MLLLHVYINVACQAMCLFLRAVDYETDAELMFVTFGNEISQIMSQTAFTYKEADQPVM